MPPTYDVYGFCSCGQAHGTMIKFDSKTDFGGDPTRLGDPYAGVRLPAKEVEIMNVGFICPKTGEESLILYNDDVFLVRVKNTP